MPLSQVSAWSWVGAGAGGEGCLWAPWSRGACSQGSAADPSLRGRVERSSFEIRPTAPELCRFLTATVGYEPRPLSVLFAAKGTSGQRHTWGDAGFRTGSSCLSWSKYLEGEERASGRAAPERAWRACGPAAGRPGPRPLDPSAAPPPQALFAVTARR